jgi:hypothetical protein
MRGYYRWHYLIANTSKWIGGGNATAVSAAFVNIDTGWVSTGGGNNGKIRLEPGGKARCFYD